MTDSKPMLRMAAAALLLLGATLPQTAAAQDAATPTPEAVGPETVGPETVGQDSQTPEALRSEGEALVTGSGDLDQDVTAGIARLEQAVAAGDIVAMRLLGGYLLDGFYLPAETGRGADLLQQAADAGDARAQAMLGAALLWGTTGTPDPAGGQALLEQAVANGDAGARRLLGEQLVGGWVLPRDAATGARLLREAVEAGDARAMVTLGEFHLNGTGVTQDRAEARNLIEQAAALGETRGLASLGGAIMWEQSDPAEAEALLRRAGEAGSGRAWSTLAEGAMYGYLGAGSRGKFDEYAARATAAGEDRVAVLEAQRRMWGISMRASGPETLGLLQDAARAGNAEAARFLIALERDGNRMNIRKRPDAAAAHLEEFRDLLPEVEAAQLAFTIDAARTRQVPAFGALADRLAARPDLRSTGFARELYRANPNLAIYLVQDRLAGAGLYGGPRDGLATAATLRAMGTACGTLPDTTRCSDSVMHPDVIAQIIAGG